MANSRIHRRSVLKGIGALGVGGALAALDGPARAVQAAPAAASDPALEGVWLGPVTLAGSPPFQALFTFMKGGTMIETDQTVDSPTFKVSPALGVWADTGNRTARFRFVDFHFDGAGNPIGSGHAVGTLTLSVDGNSYTGTGTVTSKNLGGKVVRVLPLTMHGARVRLDGND